MKYLKYWIILAIVVGAFLRLWRLGDNPPGLSWDEAALGYNAYSILKTGKDEWGAYLPLTLKSFHDYKPALYAYLTIPSEALFGLSALAVRLPSALAGIVALTVLPFLVFKLALMIDELASPQKARLLATVSTWLLAVSPWHLQFSRGAFEANLGLTLFLIGATLFVWSLDQSRLLPIATTFFGLSLYAYHAPRLVVPVWLTAMAWLFGRQLVASKRWLAISLALAIGLSFPLVRIAQYGGLLGRYQAVKIGAKDHNRSRIGILNQPVFEFSRSFIAGYLAHFNPDFLVIKGDAQDLDPAGRHRAVDTGVMLWASLPFFGYGLYRLFGFKGKGKAVIVTWLLLGPLPASLTKEAPHAIRAILMLPMPELITGLGLVLAIGGVQRGRRLAAAGVITLFGLNAVIYLHNYHVHTPLEWSRYWQYGYQQVVESTAELVGNYQQVVVTRKYDQPYIFFLFYGRVDPGWYQAKGSQEGFGPYRFREFNLAAEGRAGVLAVAAPDEVGEQGRVLKKIYFLDGEEAFRLVDFPSAAFTGDD